MPLEPTYSLTPRPCRYCQAPILWMEREPGKWQAITPQGELHSCLGTIQVKKRKTHQFVNRRKEA